MIRRFLFTLCMVACAVAANAQSAFFQKCENEAGMSTVYITKAMLRMVGSMKIDGASELTAIADKLDVVEIVSADKESSKPKLMKAAGELVSAKGYELLMKVKDDGDNVSIYQAKLKNGHNRFVLVADDAVILFEGTLTLDDVSGYVNSK